MRNVVRSAGFARTRVGIGAVGAVLGLVVIYRTAASVGLDWRGLPAYVLGAALVALGVVRWREYRAARSDA
jgi:hypothetical protein